MAKLDFGGASCQSASHASAGRGRRSVPVMNTQLVDQHWFISLHGKRYGPYTFAALAEAAAKGVITADTNVWRLGWQQWHPASQVPGLLADAPPEPVADDEAEASDTRAPVDEDDA